MLAGVQQRRNVPPPELSEVTLMSVDPVPSEQGVSAMDGTCPNVCYRNGCYWFWNQYCHYYPGGDGYCYLSLCGCGC